MPPLNKPTIAFIITTMSIIITTMDNTHIHIVHAHQALSTLPTTMSVHPIRPRIMLKPKFSQTSLQSHPKTAAVAASVLAPNTNTFDITMA
jgi:hypothetical protein